MEDSTYTLYLPGPSRSEPRKLELPVRPVVSITSAHSDPQEDYTSDTQVAAGDMVLDGNLGEIWLTPDASSSWSIGGRANKVVVVAGYASTPPDLVAICAALVRHLWNLRNTQGRDNIQQQPDGQTLIPKPVQQMLGPYRVWRAVVA